MNTNLYANPDVIKSRNPSSRNVWLGTLSSAIAVILGKYIICGDKIEFKETSREYGDKDNIDKLIDYLHKQGEMWINKEGKINETISLLSKDKDVSKVEKIVEDLTEVFNNVKNKSVKNPKKLINYMYILDALSDIALKSQTHFSCNNLDCDVCGDD